MRSWCVGLLVAGCTGGGSGGQDAALDAASDGSANVIGACGLDIASVRTTVPNPRELVIADLDGDANMEVLVPSESQLQVFRGSALASSTIDVGVGPITAAVGDFDEDGRRDLATVRWHEPHGVSVWRGLEPSGFAMLPQTNAVVANKLVAADLTMDGHLDLVGATSSGVHLLAGSGTGAFTPMPEWAVGQTQALELADIDGDGRLDVLSLSAFQLAVRKSSTSTTRVYPTGGVYPRDFALGDIDADGDTDIAVVNGDNDSVRLFLNAAGVFESTLDLNTDFPDGSDGAGTGSGSNLGSWVPRTIVMADVTGDGKLDLVVLIAPYLPTENASQLLVLENVAGLTFSDRTCMLPTRPIDVVAGDFGGDPRTDLLVLGADYNAEPGGSLMIVQQSP